MQTKAFEEKREMDRICSSSANTTATKSSRPDCEIEDGASKAAAHTQVRNEDFSHFGEKNLAKEENPLQCWKTNKDRCPMLVRIQIRSMHIWHLLII